MEIKRATLLVAITFAVAVAPVGASVIPVGIAAFGPSSTLTAFTGLADGVEVDGLVVNGITFDYSLGPGDLIIDAGPGTTNNVVPPNIVSVGDPTGTLSLLFPSLIDTFGYGYALLTSGAIPNATTISLFNGAVGVGSLSFNAVDDPNFAGGFAGIQSTLPFNRADLTFTNSAPAFAVDNIRTQAPTTAVPDSSSALVLVGLATTALARIRRTLRRS